MICPRCSAKVPFAKERCDNCGMDLKNYRRIISLSNIYYNKGLEQAKVRDLSGAIASLGRSLELNKLNTNARNLLGLIYFEEGEIVAALSEWVLSKHFQPSNNEADKYINEVQANPNKLDMYNQTLKKYNSALDAAKHGDQDMAIIQLKKVVSVNPRFIQASQLLALLYMMSGKNDNRVRAKKLLKNIERVDVTNTTTIRYLNELKDVHLKGETQQKEIPKAEQPPAKKVLPRVDADAYKTITPYKEERPSVLPFINVLVGVAIGMALMGFLIIPHINSNKSKEANSDFNKYSEQKAASDSDLSTVKNERDKLQEELDTLKQENEELKGDESAAGFKESYENLVAAMQAYIDKDMTDAAQKLAKVNEETLEGDQAKEIYTKIKEASYGKASDELFLKGRDAYNGLNDFAGKRDFDKALKILKNALKYNPDNTDAMFFIGRAYQQKSDTENAKKYYSKIIDEYPDSSRVSEAQTYLRGLGE